MTAPAARARAIVSAVLGGGPTPHVAVVVTRDGVALATRGGPPGGPGRHSWSLPAADAASLVANLEQGCRPRWVWWSAAETVPRLCAAPYAIRVRSCWDLSAVHRLLVGGWPADPARIWAWRQQLSMDGLPVTGQLDLFGSDLADDYDGTADEPVRPDGYLRPDWAGGAWERSLDAAARWVTLALDVAGAQAAALTVDRSDRGGDRLLTAQSESAADLLAAELALDGLPVDRAEAERVHSSLIGPRPTDDEAAARTREDRDRQVLRHLPPGVDPSATDLRNPAQVKLVLSRVGLDLPDTRSWRLLEHKDAHPVVPALLEWRKTERIATTYGYGWLDRHVGPDGRLRGAWTGSDGGAGRMTAQAGLHSMPTELRSIVAAEPGHLLVRADLGQIEPRVLAAVSGDPALAAATVDDDLYSPVAQRLGCTRPIAKIAVLAAMYGQTSGPAGAALDALKKAYPVAMRYLRAGEDAGRTARAVRTYGGRLVQSRRIEPPADTSEAARGAYRSAVAAQGRYVRNALVQGAAAELFKAWAASVRAELLGTGATIVLCLHDELLLHVPADAADAVADAVRRLLDSTAVRWFPPDPAVRFVADISVIARWSEAKG